MNRLILVTGASASGKSEHAERIACELPAPRTYAATMRIFGEEGRMRVERHRKLRAGKGFSTLECPRDLQLAEPPEGGTVLLECLGNLLANEMFDNCGEPLADPIEKILSGIRRLAGRSNLVIVTNEIFSDGIEYDPETRRYVDFLGRLNREIATEADSVFESVCGILLILKDKRT